MKIEQTNNFEGKKGFEDFSGLLEDENKGFFSKMSGGAKSIFNKAYEGIKKVPVAERMIGKMGIAYNQHWIDSHEKVATKKQVALENTETEINTLSSVRSEMVDAIQTLEQEGVSTTPLQRGLKNIDKKTLKKMGESDKHQSKLEARVDLMTIYTNKRDHIADQAISKYDQKIEPLNLEMQRLALLREKVKMVIEETKRKNEAQRKVLSQLLDKKLRIEEAYRKGGIKDGAGGITGGRISKISAVKELQKVIEQGYDKLHNEEDKLFSKKLEIDIKIAKLERKANPYRDRRENLIRVKENRPIEFGIAQRERSENRDYELDTVAHLKNNLENLYNKDSEDTSEPENMPDELDTQKPENGPRFLSEEEKGMMSGFSEQDIGKKFGENIKWNESGDFGVNIYKEGKLFWKKYHVKMYNRQGEDGYEYVDYKILNKEIIKKEKEAILEANRAMSILSDKENDSFELVINEKEGKVYEINSVPKAEELPAESPELPAASIPEVPAPSTSEASNVATVEKKKKSLRERISSWFSSKKKETKSPETKIDNKDEAAAQEKISLEEQEKKEAERKLREEQEKSGALRASEMDAEYKLKKEQEESDALRASLMDVEKLNLKYPFEWKIYKSTDDDGTPFNSREGTFNLETITGKVEIIILEEQTEWKKSKSAGLKKVLTLGLKDFGKFLVKEKPTWKVSIETNGKDSYPHEFATIEEAAAYAEKIIDDETKIKDEAAAQEKISLEEQEKKEAERKLREEQEKSGALRASEMDAEDKLREEQERSGSIRAKKMEKELRKNAPKKSFSERFPRIAEIFMQRELTEEESRAKDEKDLNIIIEKEIKNDNSERGKIATELSPKTLRSFIDIRRDQTAEEIDLNLKFLSKKTARQIAKSYEASFRFNNPSLKFSEEAAKELIKGNVNIVFGGHANEEVILPDEIIKILAKSKGKIEFSSDSCQHKLDNFREELTKSTD